MPSNPQLNGPDYLMLGFDHELRRHGYAGNTCQIVLELGGTLSPEALTRRLAEVTAQHPILNARPGGWLWPHWRIPRTPTPPPVRLHRGGVSAQALLNEPLDARRGELIRFDLCERTGGGQTLIFTWLHALMDAPGAEQFLALVAHQHTVLPPPPAARPPAQLPNCRCVPASSSRGSTCITSTRSVSRCQSPSASASPPRPPNSFTAWRPSMPPRPPPSVRTPTNSPDSWAKRNSTPPSR